MTWIETGFTTCLRISLCVLCALALFALNTMYMAVRNIAGRLSMFYQWQDDDLVVNIRVQPRAAHDGFAGPMGDQIKLRITAPPVDGKANRHLVAFLAKMFKVAKADISIVAGETGRNKRVRIRRPTQLPAIIGQRH